MKKFFIFIVAVIFLFVAGLGIFLATFDANRYRPQISEALQKALGNPVDIGVISLKWQNGVALSITGLMVYPDAARKGKPGISLDNAGVSVDLVPLLQRKIQVTSIVLDKPFVDILHRADGSVLIGGIDFSKKFSPASPSKDTFSQKEQAAALLFSIDSIALNAGHVRFRDESGPSAFDMEVKNIDVRVRNFSLTGPFSFEAAASVFSGKQNIRTSGLVGLPAGSKPGFFENLVIETDLSELNIQEIAALKSAGLKSPLRGKVDARFERLELSPEALKSAKGTMTLKNGSVASNSLSFPIEKIDLEAALAVDTVILKHLTADVVGGLFEFSGKIEGFDTRQAVTVKGSVKELAIDKIVKAAHAKAPQLSGHVAMDIEGSATGLAWESFSRTLSGRARIMSNDGVLLNYNVLKGIIDKLSVIPGAQQAFASNFPQAYQLRLQEKSTVFKPIDLQARIVNGVFNVDPIVLETDFVLLHGAGQLGLDRSLQIRANLIMNAEISKACVGVINPIQYLCNNRGEVVVPVQISGELPEVKVFADTKYIKGKLLASVAQGAVQEIISDPQAGIGKIQDLLNKNIKGLGIDSLDKK